MVNGYDIMRSTFATLRILLEMFNLKRSTKPAAGGKSLKNKQILKWQTVRSAYPMCHTMYCVQIPTCSSCSTISHKTFYPWTQLSIFSALRIWLQKNCHFLLFVGFQSLVSDPLRWQPVTVSFSLGQSPIIILDSCWFMMKIYTYSKVSRPSWKKCNLINYAFFIPIITGCVPKDSEARRNPQTMEWTISNTVSKHIIKTPHPCE